MVCTDRNAARIIRRQQLNNSKIWHSGKWRALTTVSATALLVAAIAPAAYAQSAQSAQAAPQAAQAPAVEEVVVTATRIVRDGYEAPTPTTVLSAEAITANAPTNIADYVNTMPSLAGSTTPRTGNTGSSGGTTGLNALNLRGLGANRTLVLLDGRRVTPSSASNLVDVSDFPQSLVSRVDVVTGGASASWGSDAVAGVVNFITDSKFVGLKGDVQGGVTTYGDDRNWKVSLTGGTGFGGDRGHFIISGDYAYQAGIGILDPGRTVPISQQLPRSWYNGTHGFTNPNYTATNGQPNLYIASGVGMVVAAPGGIIAGNIAGNGPLKNVAFGPGGVPFNADFGAGGGIVSYSSAVGQAPDWQYYDIGSEGSLDARLQDQHVFTRLTYDVTDNVEVFAEASYGYAYSLTSCCAAYYLPNASPNGVGLKPNTVISINNPFIPASILATMQANNMTTITLGSWNSDIGPLGTRNYRSTTHETIGANGNFDMMDKKWSWNAYFENGLARTTDDAPNETIVDRYGQAIQAVRNPTTGAIQCADPSNGCVPYDIFGVGVNSQAAKNYVTGLAHQNQDIRQRVVAASLNGDPIEDWAGPISLALGGEYRNLSATGTQDPLSTINDYFSGNFHAIIGSYHVTEGFVETVVPLATNLPWSKSLDLDLAARETDYSASGYVTTWKAGVNYAPVDDIHFRIVQSRDIRAPTLVDLYSPPKPTTTNINDDALTGKPSEVITQHALGNTALVPEKANSTTLGAVFQPTFLPGFNASVDYYRINVTGAIASFTPQQVIDECYQQNIASFCPFIVRVSPGAAASTTNPITFVNLVPINFQSQITKGIDIEASYGIPLQNVVDSWDGTFTAHTYWTHIITNASNSGLPGVPVTENAGVNSGSTPSWKGVLALDYTNDTIHFGLTERWVSGGVYSHLYIECASACPTSGANGQPGQTINNNHIPGAAYTDLSMAYKFGSDVHYEAFLTVSNLLNKDPPPVAGINGLTYISNGTNPNIYDTIGRMFHAGMRFKM